MHRITGLLLSNPLAAYGYARSASVASPQLGSGITTSNGGAIGVLGDDPGVGINTRVTPVR